MAQAHDVHYHGRMDNFLVHTKEMKPRDWLFDAAVALCAFAFGCVQLYISSMSITGHDDLFRQLLGLSDARYSVSAYAALALTTLPLALRRKFPWPVFIFVIIVFLGTQWLLRGYSLALVGPIIALYTIAHERPRFEALVAASIGVLSTAFFGVPALDAQMSILMRIQNAALLAGGALAGFAFKTHQEYVRETEQRAIAAEKSSEEEAARRIEEERVRIAREIHDITAHSLSAVSVQAAAAERLVDADPEAAKEAIRNVRTTSKKSLDEIRSMIGVLRNDDARRETKPIEGTDRLVDVVAYLEDAGIEVDYDASSYDRACVPVYIDVALFGIAREAATNIIRHAQAKKTTIRLGCDTEKATLLIEDDGIGMQQGGDGHGLQGMQERVGLLAGTLYAGNNAGKGFAVRVAIPVKEIGDATWPKR